MTTTDTASKFRYQGNGSTDTFAFSGRVFATSDIIVEIVTRATDALVETLTESTHYDVTIAADGTASVEITSAPKIPSALQDIILRRSVPQAQSVSLPTGTQFPAKTVETALDKLTALVQDLEEVVNRSIKLPAQTSATTGITANPEDDKILAWDGTDGAIKNGPTTASFSAATATAVAAAATATSAAASASTSATTASTQAGLATNQVAYAEEWAQNPEDDPVSVAAGGDNTTTYSALHWAAKAEEFAQSINLPTLGAADTVLQVNSAGNALEYGKVATANITSGAATNGQVLTANGSGGVSFATAGGGVSHILTQTISTPVSYVQFDNLDDYDHVWFTIEDLDPSGNGYVVCRTSADGSTFDNGASDYTHGFAINTASTFSAAAPPTTANNDIGLITPNFIEAGSDYPPFFSIHLPKPGVVTAEYKAFYNDINFKNNGTDVSMGKSTTWRRSTAIIASVRFFVDDDAGGTITLDRGRISMYAVRKS